MEETLEIILKGLRTLFGYICEIIYPAISDLYELFLELGNQVYREDFNVIYQKISLIIGIFMVFRLTFWLIESLINPSNLNDKEKNPGKIIQKVLVSVILLAITPTIFEYAFDFQTKVLNSQILEKILLPSVEENVVADTGNLLASELLNNFYTPTQLDDGEPVDSHCNNVVIANIASLRNEGLLNNFTNNCLTETMIINEDEEIFVIDFNGIFAVAVGVFVLWMILMYCISLGTRYVQLIFLQIIAPVPIICNLAPGKDNMFDKWVKQCTTTYLDLFIRVVIINFVVLISGVLLKSANGIILSNNKYITIFLVLGLLTFAKKAPELIQDLLPKGLAKASGDFGLSLKKRTESMLGGKLMYNTMKKAPGYAAGGIAGAALGGAMGVLGGKGVGSRVMGGLSGAMHGFKTGGKKGWLKGIGDVKKNQASANMKLQQWRIAAGKEDDEPNTFADWKSRKGDALKKNVGLFTSGDILKNVDADAKKANGALKSYRSYINGKAEEGRQKITYVDKLTGQKITTSIDNLKVDYERKDNIYKNMDNNQLVAEGLTKIKDSFYGESYSDKQINQVKMQKQIMKEYYQQKGMNEVDADNAADAYLNDSDIQHTDEEIARAYAETQTIRAREEAAIAKNLYEKQQDRAGFNEMLARIGKRENGKLVGDEQANNLINSLNEFIKNNDEYLNLTSAGTDADGNEIPALLPKGFKEFNLDILKKETHSNEEIAEIEKMFEAWKSLKGLETRTDSFNASKTTKLSQANSNFNK